MKPMIFDLLFNDDRMFVMEISPVTTRMLTSNDPPKNEWAVITRRNVPGYPPHRSDSFPSRDDAIDYYRRIVVTTPRVSLGKISPESPPSIDEYKQWLGDERLYDPLLNPDAPVKGESS